MYSLVMLAAMSPGGDPAPVVGTPVVVSSGCVGCFGCGGYSACYGYSGSCSGCFGSCFGSCSGCTGSCHGGLFHGRGGLFGHHKHSCGGCSGYNCNGWNCFGSCFGSCTGCTGCTGCSGWSCVGWGSGVGYNGGWSAAAAAGSAGATGSGTFGYVGSAFHSGVLQGTAFSCHGGCYGGYYGGGSTWGPPVNVPAATLSGYSTAASGPPPSIYGDPHAVFGNVTNMNPPTYTEAPAEPKADDMKDKDGKDKDGKGTGANIKFRLPPAAQLYVDGRLTTLTGSERVFTTPRLAPGQKFYYEVKAVFATDGEPVVEERRVIVEAGASLTEAFPTLFAAAEAKAKGRAVAGK